jgi:hypothetical protein
LSTTNTQSDRAELGSSSSASRNLLEACDGRWLRWQRMDKEKDNGNVPFGVGLESVWDRPRVGLNVARGSCKRVKGH